ncbi:tripartite tricarboxylate transporter TctB family protein [Geochorda subterranea]|uniref:tripartite tricarboxylate transporter TctB family protein n=1 Tax=Geochorda subterranea TaxID=3109564 RepID=UPI0038601D17
MLRGLLSGDRGIGLVLGAGSVPIGLHAIRELGLVHGRLPGPGLFPFILSVSLLAASAHLALIRPMKVTTVGGLTAGQLRKQLTALGVYAAFPLLLPVAGYIVCTSVFVAAWTLAVEREPLSRASLAGVVAGLAVWLIFGVGLRYPLPGGWLPVR